MTETQSKFGNKVLSMIFRDEKTVWSLMNIKTFLAIYNNTTIIFYRCCRNKPKIFAFDHCFYSLDPGADNFASQEIVFDALGRDILDNAFQGYNACIFAYGQTGMISIIFSISNSYFSFITISLAVAVQFRPLNNPALTDVDLLTCQERCVSYERRMNGCVTQ